MGLHLQKNRLNMYIETNYSCYIKWFTKETQKSQLGLHNSMASGPSPAVLREEIIPFAWQHNWLLPILSLFIYIMAIHTKSILDRRVS